MGTFLGDLEKRNTGLPPPNESEGVAGAERYQGPGQPAAGRALTASDSEQWAKAGGTLLSSISTDEKNKKMSRVLRVGRKTEGAMRPDWWPRIFLPFNHMTQKPPTSRSILLNSCIVLWKGLHYF